MLKNSLQTNSVLFIGLLFFAFLTNNFAQTVGKGSVAAYVPGGDEKKGQVRKRTVENEAVKPGLPVKIPANRIFDLEKLTFSLVNQKRAEMRLATLGWSEEVAKIARLHSENMVKFGFFSHQGVDGKMVDDRADAFGITDWTALGENIAYNRGYQNPCETAVEKWLLSPTHRTNLLNDGWTETAIGIAVAPDGTYFFTQVFLK